MISFQLFITTVYDVVVVVSTWRQCAWSLALIIPKLHHVLRVQY